MNVLRSEWTKLRSVRGTWIAALSTLASAVALSVLGCCPAGSPTVPWARAPIEPSFGGGATIENPLGGETNESPAGRSIVTSAWSGEAPRMCTVSFAVWPTTGAFESDASIRTQARNSLWPFSSVQGWAGLVAA